MAPTSLPLEDQQKTIYTNNILLFQGIPIPWDSDDTLTGNYDKKRFCSMTLKSL